MGPIPLDVVVGTSDSFFLGYLKTNSKSNKNEIRYNTIINGSRRILFYDVRVRIRDKNFVSIIIT